MAHLGQDRASTRGERATRPTLLSHGALKFQSRDSYRDWEAALAKPSLQPPPNPPPSGAMLAAFFLPVLAWGCPRGPVSGTTVLIDPSTNQAQFFNGYVCAIVAPGRVVDLRADFQGRGEYGANVLASAGMTLQSEDAFGRVASSGDLKPEDVQWAVAKNETSNATATMSGVCDRKNAPRATETWTFTLLSSSRTIEFQARGSTPGSKLRAIRRQWDLQSTSIYAMYDGGLVQMKGAGGGSDFYASDDGLGRVYSLGGSGSEEGQVGNMSIDIIRSEKARASQTVLMSSKSGSPYWSGLQEVLAGGISDKSILDHWKGGWAKVPAKNINPGLTWSHNTVIGVNDFDFPVGALAPPSDVNMELSDIHATMMGIYASPVGCLCTHINEVSEGEAVGQIATSIARPDRGYQGTYNYFDPDNYMSISAMLWSNDPYLQAQARRVLERSGAFLKPSGQLPHHFQGTDPVYQALSGEIQTGPNVFWVLSCFRYAKSSQDLEWLRGYMPRLRNATAFLFSLVDPKESLAKVPGSLMIDVFLRSNYTSDTNAMLVGFLREFAEAEEFVGNSTGAASLRSLSDAIATAMNERLWDAESDDHYVTQWDGPAAGTKRDFIDYDANLIAGAHGYVGCARFYIINSAVDLFFRVFRSIPDKDMAGRMLKRIDGGQCRPSATFVSEKYYGKDDTANGNIGDSWTAMVHTVSSFFIFFWHYLLFIFL